MANKILNDFPYGPLEKYRKLASFDWKKLKFFIETEEMIIFEDNIIQRLKNNSIFNSVTVTSLDDKYHLSVQRMLTLMRMCLLDGNNSIDNLKKASILLKVLVHFDPSTIAKYTICSICSDVFRSLGTERHYPYLEDCMNGKRIVCFCLTEIAHGSNAKGMRTTATYDIKTEQFILNTPDFEAAKCWAGNLGKCATYSIVYAQLYTPDGKCHGLHSFVVDLRDKDTLKPYPGIIIGDMGAKAGLHGLDNGFIIFNNYAIPRKNLLNRTGDVTSDGKYITSLENPSRRLGTSLGALSKARGNIILIGTTYFEKAITIAIRYAAVRKQFGPTDHEELPILEYQLHQWRLLPYLAACYVFKIFYLFFCNINAQFQTDLTLSGNKDKLAKLGMEIHAISSAGKAVSSWIIRDGIQECREACGGHGYLQVSELPDLRNYHDANCTYEGESNILCQQTSNWLIKFWPLLLKEENIPLTPLGSIYYLSNAKQILNTKFEANTVAEAVSPNSIINAYKWLVCYLLKESYKKLQKLRQQGQDTFTAKNNTQTFYMRTLSIVYFEHFMVQKMLETINAADDISIKNILTKLLSLYGVWSLDKHMSILYQGGYANGTNPAKFIKEGILILCEQIKPDAVTLVDTIAPNDFLMKSPLGKSDGQVYKHLEAAFMNAPNALLSRPDWWQDLVVSKAKL